MLSRTFFPAILISFVFISNTAYSQAKQSKPEPKRDTSQVHSISIADLEMIDPENRLIPESKEDAQQWSFEGYVESPMSSTKVSQPSNGNSKITTHDLEMLESITPPKQQASDAPSR
jgi:hypothetical protein